MKLALIGCGNIAELHVPAFKAAGFDVCCVAGSLNSINVDDFAKRHQIDKVYKDPDDLVHSNLWDAILIVSSIDSILGYIKKSSVYNKPILVEKPVSLNYKELDSVLDFDNVYVAYNRRFYSTTSYANDFLKNHKKSLIKITIPESSMGELGFNSFPNLLPSRVYENSVHVIDLVNYIAGKIEWTHVDHLLDKEKYLSVSALGISKEGHNIILNVCFDAPDNFSIDITNGNERIEMRPIEIAYHYKGMRVEEPSDDIPIRRYLPLVKNTVINSSSREELKPGFYEQANDFMDICKGEKITNSATLIDAKNALEVVHRLRNNI